MKTILKSFFIIAAFSSISFAQPYTVAELDNLFPSNGQYNAADYFETKPYMQNSSGNPCQNIGEGSSQSDAVLNSYKNRDIAPSSYVNLDLKRLIKTKPSDNVVYNSGTMESDWSNSVKEEMMGYQRLPIRIEGYFIYAKGEGAESCNCGNTTLTDYHTWVSPFKLSANAPTNPKKDKSKALVAEISPFLLGANHTSEHPHWNTAKINKIAKQRRKVRVFGWLTWDKQHASQLQGTSTIPAIRKTLWEVHPVHKIQVKYGNAWIDLDNYNHW